MTAPDLKPCPFCGGEARAEKSKTITDAWVVECKKGHSDGCIYVVKDHAIAAWNIRTTPLDDVLAAAQAYIEGLEAHEGAEGFSLSTAELSSAYYAALRAIGEGNNAAIQVIKETK